MTIRVAGRRSAATMRRTRLCIRNRSTGSRWCGRGNRAASDGKQRERTIRRFDEHGRMMELKSVDSDKAAVQMTLRYDDLGRPVESQVTFKSENGLAFSGGVFAGSVAAQTVE